LRNTVAVIPLSREDIPGCPGYKEEQQLYQTKEQRWEQTMHKE